MRNPFRSEEEAFRFLILTIAYFGLIAVADQINGWVAVGAFVVETAVVIWWLMRRDEPVAPEAQVPAAHPAGERRILVIANETVGGHALLTEIHRRADGVRANVLVVSPALNSPVRHWASDEDGARAAAQERLDESLAVMRADGMAARGEIGDGDPLQAIEDALRTFAPDDLIISTHPVGRSNWLERDVVVHARERFALPVTHVVVDLEVIEAQASEG